VLGFLCGEALRDLVRAGWIALSSVLLIALSLLTLGGFWVCSTNLGGAVARWREQLRIIVYLKTEPSPAAAGALGQRIRAAGDVAQLDEFGTCPGQCVVLRGVHRRLHLGKCFDVLERLRGGLDRGARQQIGYDFDPLFDAVQRVLEIDDDQPEEAQDEQREGDRRHREDGQQRRALEGEHRFAEGEVHGAAAWSRASSTAESYTKAPSWSSITR